MSVHCRGRYCTTAHVQLVLYFCVSLCGITHCAWLHHIRTGIANDFQVYSAIICLSVFLFLSDVVAWLVLRDFVLLIILFVGFKEKKKKEECRLCLDCLWWISHRKLKRRTKGHPSRILLCTYSSISSAYGRSWLEKEGECTRKSIIWLIFLSPFFFFSFPLPFFRCGPERPRSSYR
jgi:hypothetical protein